jgi:recA bacterial DNA recombination protein
MSSFPLFSNTPEGRPIFASSSPREIFVKTLLTTSLPGIVPASRLEVRPAPEMVSSGVRELDALTGGLPRGCLTEVCGAASSGRTSLLLAILASATQRKEACALVDGTDSFNPQSAASAEVNFEKLLWVRCGGQKNVSPRRHRDTEKNNVQKLETPIDQALRVTDLLLQSGGFGLVVIDLADVPFKTARRIPLTSWFRFQRAVEHTPTVLLVITPAPCAQTCAALLLRMEASVKKVLAVSFQRSVPHAELLEGFVTHAEVLRSRLARKPSRSVTAFTTTAVRTG